MVKPRLLLADDHQLLVDGLRKLLEAEFDLVATVADGRAAVAAYQRLLPDLILLDVGLPLLNGIEVARQIKAAAPSARILFVTMQTDRIYVEEGMRAGGLGYVSKQAAARELVEAIHAVLSGRFYISPQIANRLGPAVFDSSPSQAPHFASGLTPRQREVLQLTAEGKSMKEIADILRISVRTVEFHRNSIMDRLGLSSTAALIRYAVDQGITP